jgi:murein DD-endopeptidase MepM/ murein hydrolase activator NlpD
MQEPLAERLLARVTQTGRGNVGAARLLGNASGMTGPTARWLRLRVTARWSDDLLMSRAAAHMAVLVLVGLVIVLGSTLPLPSSLTTPWVIPSATRAEVGDLAPPASPREAQPGGVRLFSSAQVASRFFGLTTLNNNGELLVRAAVPHTIIPERPRDEMVRYVVQSGDTIFGIAAQFGVAPETIMWANGQFVEDNPDLLRVGQELTILPTDGVYHQVGSSDTVEKIAATYKVEPAAIISYPLNKMDANNPQIVAGQWLIVPGGTKPYVPRTVAAYNGPVPEDASKGSGIFGWPATGQITQNFWEHHRALDVGSWEGAPVLAADSGYVVAAGWDDSGFGRIVLIDHGNGFQTLYAHMQVYYVEVGQSIAKGEQIGEVGSTGNSSGPHLHFEVLQDGVQRNPFGFLP